MHTHAEHFEGLDSLPAAEVRVRHVLTHTHIHPALHAHSMDMGPQAYPPLDFNKVKNTLQSGSNLTEQVALLQALRWVGQPHPPTNTPHSLMHYSYRD